MYGNNLNYSDDEERLNSDSDDIDYTGGLNHSTKPSTLNLSSQTLIAPTINVNV